MSLGSRANCSILHTRIPPAAVAHLLGSLDSNAISPTISATSHGNHNTNAALHFNHHNNNAALHFNHHNNNAVIPNRRAAAREESAVWNAAQISLLLIIRGHHPSNAASFKPPRAKLRDSTRGISP